MVLHVAAPAAPVALQKYNLPPLAMICPTVPAVPAEVGAAPDAATVNVVAVICPVLSPAVPLPIAREAAARREMPVSAAFVASAVYAHVRVVSLANCNALVEFLAAIQTLVAPPVALIANRFCNCKLPEKFPAVPLPMSSTPAESREMPESGAFV